MLQKKKLKVYTAGGWSDGEWINNSTPTKNFEEADILILPGGNDINPKLYKEPQGRFTQSPVDRRDELEIDLFYKAVETGKIIIGICRGFQLISVLNGSKLIQHTTNHHGQHECQTYDGQVYNMNSIHHQMVYPWDLQEDEYNLISWTLGNSTTYLDGWNRETEFPEQAFLNGEIIEPEIIFYPDTKCFGIQGHPENLWYKQGDENYTLDYINKQLEMAMEDSQVFNKMKIKEKENV